MEGALVTFAYSPLSAPKQTFRKQQHVGKMPLSRQNSCVDIDWTLRKVFKRRSFRLAYVSRNKDAFTDSTGLYNAKSSRPLLTVKMCFFRLLRLSERVFAFNYLL